MSTSVECVSSETVLTHQTMKVLVLIFVVATGPAFGLWQTMDAAAQPSSAVEPFATLRLAVGTGTVVGQQGMAAWSPGLDMRFSVDTPYAGSRLRLDMATRAWSGTRSSVTDGAGSVMPQELPDVRTIDILAGWGLSAPSEAPILLDGGLMLGNRFMLFDLPASAAGRLESEMLVGPWLRAGHAFGTLKIFAELRALRVLTRPRWDTVGISAGIALEASTPGWIRWILQ